MISLFVTGYSRDQVNYCGGEGNPFPPDYVIPDTYNSVLNVCPCAGSAQLRRTYSA